MNQRDIAVLMDGIAPVLRGYVEKAFEPIGARLLAIEQRFDALPVPRDGKDADPVVILRLVEETVAKVPPAPAGRDGKDADPELVAALVDKAVAALEPAKDGAPGPAGESVTLEELAPFVAEEVSKAVAVELEKIAATLPAGKDGAPGEPGKSVAIEELAPVIDEIVARKLAEIPPAKDGLDGKEGQPGRDGRDGLPGLRGEPGTDGRDGVDGLGIDDLDVRSIGDGRSLEISLKREGAEPIVKEIRLATVLDRGVWREQPFEKGDGVTWGGSFFIAQRATETLEKPGASDAWRLSIKKGRDGKDGRDGRNGIDGKDGAPGRDGRNGF